MPFAESSGAYPRSIEIPRRCSSGSRSVSLPVSARTSQVLPWSTCPAVPTVSGKRAPRAASSTSPSESVRQSSSSAPSRTTPTTAGSPPATARQAPLRPHTQSSPAPPAEAHPPTRATVASTLRRPGGQSFRPRPNRRLRLDQHAQHRISRSAWPARGRRRVSPPGRPASACRRARPAGADAAAAARRAPLARRPPPPAARRAACPPRSTRGRPPPRRSPARTAVGTSAITPDPASSTTGRPCRRPTATTSPSRGRSANPTTRKFDW